MHIKKQFLEFIRIQKPRRLSNLGLLAGVVLAQGAPLGLLLHNYFLGNKNAENFFQHVKLSLVKEAATYLYVWFGTAFYFALFGWFAATLLSTWINELNRTKHSMELFSRFDQLNRKVQNQIHSRLKSPAASISEFLDSMEKGLFGQFTKEQNTLIHDFLADIGQIHKQGDSDVSGGKSFSTTLDVLSPIFNEFGVSFNTITNQNILFENSLLQAALRELLTDLTDNRRKKIKVFIKQSPTAEWDYGGYVLLCFEGAKNSNNTPAWNIARYILEWHNGFVLQDSNGIFVGLPLSTTEDTERRAA